MTANYSLPANGGCPYTDVHCTEATDLQSVLSSFFVTPGGWLAENSFELPKDAPPGTYVFVNRIQADDGSEDRRDAVFILTEG